MCEYEEQAEVQDADLGREMALSLALIELARIIAGTANPQAELARLQGLIEGGADPIELLALLKAVDPIHLPEGYAVMRVQVHPETKPLSEQAAVVRRRLSEAFDPMRVEAARQIALATTRSSLKDSNGNPAWDGAFAHGTRPSSIANHDRAEVHGHACPSCGAEWNQLCRTSSGRAAQYPHAARLERARSFR